MKALVTGADSFIGSTLIEELNTLGFEVFALKQEAQSFDSLCKHVQNADYIFHLEGMAEASRRSLLFKANTEATARLARAVSESRPSLSRFVYLSSIAAAGPAKSLQPRSESDSNHPVSAFGESKLQAEQALLNYKDIFPISIVRPSLVYGPGDRVTSFLVQVIARNLMPVLQGATQKGHKYFSTIHVKDLCRGLVQAAVAPIKKVPSGEIFYLAEDDFHTYQELILNIAEKLNIDPLQVRVPNFAIQVAAISLSIIGFVTQKPFLLNRDRFKEVISDYWICSNQKAKRMLDFTTEFDLSTGIAHSIDWYKRNKWI